MESRKSWLKNQLLNHKTIDVVESYLQNDTQQRWKAYHTQLSSDKFYLPVFGVQGSGKSTLLNSLFFNERILPTDARETTCVPAELHYLPEKIGKAKVVFKDGSSIEIPAQDSILAEYIDNVYNPGNSKGVKIVEVYSDDPLLQNGLVIVDLPGYGSLTEENEEATKDYLKKSSGVVFLIRSVPPLTRDEVYWLRNVWPLFPQATFCQSCWDTESDEEIEDAKDHNLSVIRKEKNQIWGEKHEDPIFICVNGEGALNAKFTNNLNEFKKSGVPALMDRFQSFSQSWPSLTPIILADKFKEDIEKTKQEISTRIDVLRKSSEEVDKEISVISKEFSEYKKKATGITDSAKKTVNEFEKRLISEINQMIKTNEQSFRNKMRTVFRSGVVDGERLNTAFKEEYSDIAEQIYYDLQEEMLILQGILRAEMEGLNEWVNEMNEKEFGFYISEKTKYENILVPALNAVGGIGGIILGSAAATKIGAKVGAGAGSIAGPVGTFIGAAIGAMIGALIGGWIGRGGKKLVLDQRIKQVQPQVFGEITKVMEDLRTETSDLVMGFAKDINNSIDLWLQNQQKYYDEQMEYNLSTKQLNKEEKEKQVFELTSDSEQLASVLLEMERS